MQQEVEDGYICVNIFVKNPDSQTNHFNGSVLRRHKVPIDPNTKPIILRYSKEVDMDLYTQEHRIKRNTGTQFILGQ